MKQQAGRRNTPLSFLSILFLAILCSGGGHAGDEARGQVDDKIDGRWKASYSDPQAQSYEMEFSEGRFTANRSTEWYKGAIAIDETTVPARIDFTIEECDCNFINKTSRGIFRWDGETIEVRAPGPDSSRPTTFDAENAETMRLVRIPPRD